MDSNLPPIHEPAPAAPTPTPPVPPAPPVLRPVAASPRPERKGGRGWMILSFILAFLLIVVLCSKFIHFTSNLLNTSHSASVAPRHEMEEVTIENKSSDNKIAIIEVDGVISSSAIDRTGIDMVHSIKKQLEMAADDKDVKAVILKVDSPGGEVMASDDINKLIVQFQDKNPSKPVIASMGGMAASGGYYISAPCRWIVANELTITGSIGVIMSSYNYRGLMDKVGIRPEVYKSGKFKDMMSGAKRDDEVLPEERKMVQSLIDETFAQFKHVVSTGRGKADKSNAGKGRKLASNWADFADGRILSGKQAYDLGFVDELGDFDATVKRAYEISGISDANLIRYEEPFDLSSMFHIFGKSEAPAIKVELGVEMPKLQAGRMYFLAPTVMH